VNAAAQVPPGEPDAAPLLDVRHATRRFAGLVAVDDVSFSLAPGEILGLIGPNGAGKTTLVSLVSGTLAPTSGEIRFEGRRIETLPAYRRAHLGIGRTFQIMRPFPGLTVLDNVAVGALFGRGGGSRTGLAQAREAARACLDLVGMGAQAAQRADQLGGPGRKRLELAKALAMQPKLVLCDEVMAGLTHVEVDEVVDVIRQVRARGIAILVIEHVIHAIKSLSDRLLVLHHGEKIADGAPDDVLRSQAVVEAYLGRRRS
jgi:branched-chain amino acid transport system ATP-binding protein